MNPFRKYTLLAIVSLLGGIVFTSFSLSPEAAVVAQSNSSEGTTLDVGMEWACGKRDDGKVRCWHPSSGSSNQNLADNYLSISSGQAHVCGIKTDQSLLCWGGTTGGVTNAPVGKFVSVSVGFFYACGVRIDQTLVCWGANWYGQLDVPGGAFTTVSAGDYHVCAINTGDNIICWGNNNSGQTDAPNGSFISVSAGQYHTCAIKTDQRVVCWGDNSLGQATAPTGSFIDVSAGHSYTCGITAENRIICWGARAYIQSTNLFKSVSSHHRTCAVRTDNVIVCFDGERRQLPYVSLSSDNNTLTEGEGSSVVIQLSGINFFGTAVKLAFTGTANKGTDYTVFEQDGTPLSSNELLIEEDKSVESVLIKIADDGNLEGDETIIIDVVEVAGGLENATQQITLRILADEVPPTPIPTSTPSAVKTLWKSPTPTSTATFTRTPYFTRTPTRTVTPAP